MFKNIQKFRNINQKIIIFTYINKKTIIILFFLFLIISYNAKSNDLDINLIKVAFYCNSIKYGGVERVISLLINLLSKVKILNLYLITKQKILEGEYSVPTSIKRISLLEKKITLFNMIEKEKINILVYNFYNKKDIKRLNNLANTKIIYYDHSSFLYWIYSYAPTFNNSIYYIYRNCNYVISLIPLENEYLFKRWGINSILMDNPTTFEFDSVTPSNLENKNIIMIGRSNDPIKRYDLGIKAMINIIKEIPECKMNIISLINKYYKSLILKLKLEKFVKFVGYQRYVEIYLKNSSLHILPSLSETYPMVLSETKIFGIPSIICGLDYLALAKKGTVIIYDDEPETIAKEAIKILKNDKYRKKLGEEARKSMKKHKNDSIVKKWVKLLISIYKDDKTAYKKLLLSDHNNKITEEEADNILNNQLKLLQKRIPRYHNVSLEQFKSFSF